MNDLARQFAANALAEFCSGEVESGLAWLRGLTERHTNAFTRAMLEAALDSRWDEVIASLEHQLKWCL